MKIEALAIAIVSVLVVFTVTLLVGDGGIYCKHCHKGGNNWDVALSVYGNYPCTVAKDSCHEFQFYLINPESRTAGYKYAK